MDMKAVWEALLAWGLFSGSLSELETEQKQTEHQQTPQGLSLNFTEKKKLWKEKRLLSLGK